MLKLDRAWKTEGLVGVAIRVLFGWVGGSAPQAILLPGLKFSEEVCKYDFWWLLLFSDEIQLLLQAIYR